MQLSRKLLLQPQLRFNESLITTAGTYDMQLPAGTYFFEMCGGGGQGGTAGGGGGGAGGYGKYNVAVLKVTKPSNITLNVGAGGATGADNSGAGGAGGTGASGGKNGGAGGASGGYTLLQVNEDVSSGVSYLANYLAWIDNNGTIVYTNLSNDVKALSYTGGQSTLYASIPESELDPVISYVGTTEERWKTITANGTTYTRYPSGDVFQTGTLAVALGGGGGGGGGGYAPNGRYPGGGGGGGGGGYCAFIVDSTKSAFTRINYNGQKGGNGGGTYARGENGVSGNQSFSSLRAGNGGDGSGTANLYSQGGTGGGASGAGGGGGVNNEDPRYNTAGGGGGGAGGDLSSRGGFRGSSGYHLATNATNAAIWPLDVYDNNGNVIAGTNNSTPTWGMGGAGGQNSAAGINGADGWVQITQIG